jgi:hypothetical protein
MNAKGIGHGADRPKRNPPACMAEFGCVTAPRPGESDG